jgi:hypothetical protein
MSAPDWKAMGDPLNDRLPPRQRKAKEPAPYLTLPCEGSMLVGHPTWRGDLYGAGVMCQMCGQWYPSPPDTFDTVPDHRRPDILAMLERGDYNA